MQVDQLAGPVVQREGVKDAGMADPSAREGGSEAAPRKGSVKLRVAAGIDEKIDVLSPGKRRCEPYVAFPVAVADAELLQAIEEVAYDLLRRQAVPRRRLHRRAIFFDNAAPRYGLLILPRKA
jgi:hypothetical protein